MLGIVKYELQKREILKDFNELEIDNKLSNDINVNLKKLLIQLKNLTYNENNNLPNSKYKDQEYFLFISNNICYSHYNCFYFFFL